MCGIAGIITTNQYQNSLETRIHWIQAALQHRGPDDQGIYISCNQQAALAHTRLAILDLSQAGHQPMSTADGRYWITFNGEIYNFSQLRKNLISQGEKFQSQTDTEVILKLYQKLGTDCVHYLRGMFAFAIWDDLEKTCFLARDPLGIKPLYYWQSGSTLVFASELRAILASALPSIKLSAEGLYGYLITGSVPEPYTLISGIHCLAAGNWLYWQEGQTTKQQYWQINFSPEKISLLEAQEKVHAALVDSIQHHFISDVPVGLFLSGGIDSTAILAIATQTQNEQLHTYSIALEEQWDEGGIAQKTARHFGAKHTEYQVTESLAQQLLPHFLKAIDQPSIDGFNTFCISKIVHDNGMKVALSGLGGDEIFGGYQSFQQVPRMLRWSQQLHKLPFVTTSVGMGLESWGNSSRMKRLGDFLQQSPSLISAYQSFRGIFSTREACAITQQWLGEIARPPLPDLNEGHLTNPEDKVSFLELNCYMRNQLLRDSDVMSMNWGLELRVPLVDQVLLETVASIPSNLRLAIGKQLLIKSVPELPDWVINRPKQGFVLPFEKWINSDFGNYFQNLNVPKYIPLKPWYRRWSLLMLKYWWEQVNIKPNYSNSQNVIRVP